MRKTLHHAIGTVLVLLPGVMIAASNPDPAIIQTCVVPGLSCLGADLASYINVTILAGARIAFIGTLVAAIIYYGLRRIFTPESDSAMDETRRSFEYAILGAVLLAGAELIASSFVTGGVVAPAGVNTAFDSLTVFIKALLSAALLVNITIQGLRMITAVDEGEITKGRKRFLTGCLGAAIVLLAAPIVNTLATPSTSIAMTELKGIANYIITIFGLLAVVAIIVSGIWLILSVDEALKERAKKLATAGIIALILVLCSGALVNFFIF